jgi:hypothetical protein
MRQREAHPKGYRLYRIVRWLVWLFAPKFRLMNPGNLPEGACVIVGNHSQMYGPIASELYTPGKHFTWCAAEMMNRKEAADYAYRDFWSGKPRTVRWFFRLLSYPVAPLAEVIFTNAPTIGVYHDARVISTFRESAGALEDGGRVVIFPECYTEHNNIVHEFQERFVDVARFFYRETGKELDFVPMYVAPRRKEIWYGTPVRFRADAPAEAERRRICTELMDAITGIAVSLPEHTVVPYPNIPKRQYPRSIPLVTHEQEKDEQKTAL